VANRAFPIVEFADVDGRPALRGECDFQSIDRVQRWLASLHEGRVEVDLSGVTFFDSSALRAFLVMRRRNPEMWIVKPSQVVIRVLEITGLADYLIERPAIT
jgi:anti-sigma B factor antagonist/stage II sporulation protein AA (anti-sigma F factor antagonist)